eukprot:CAMPEP_0194295812 /NCGR_PEP_ID=MMETSP0169-20130528/54436_1 /TAXON_ID=218684 /ORGANISM="Corethron pennatum, Strain L29A3" /LENGTH=249 /DNA_ID=CAMNT_0039045077 /DNA_START=79 /DNA_END=828 /DNA_ORIENTATION=+
MPQNNFEAPGPDDDSGSQTRGKRIEDLCRSLSAVLLEVSRENSRFCTAGTIDPTHASQIRDDLRYVEERADAISKMILEERTAMERLRRLRDNALAQNRVLVAELRRVEEKEATAKVTGGENWETGEETAGAVEKKCVRFASPLPRPHLKPRKAVTFRSIFKKEFDTVPWSVRGTRTTLPALCAALSEIEDAVNEKYYWGGNAEHVDGESTDTGGAPPQISEDELRSGCNFFFPGGIVRANHSQCAPTY